MLDTHLIVPGEDTVAPDNLQQTLHEIHHQVEFQQILHMKKSMTCDVLVNLYAELRLSIKPILNYLDFLVYFHLHNCELFNKYLNQQKATVSVLKTTIDPSAIEFIEDGQSSGDKADEKFIQVCTTTRIIILWVLLVSFWRH